MAFESVPFGLSLVFSVSFFFPLATTPTIFGANLKHGLAHYLAHWTLLAFLAIGVFLGLMLTVLVSSNLPGRK